MRLGRGKVFPTKEKKPTLQKEQREATSGCHRNQVKCVMAMAQSPSSSYS